MSRGNKTVLAMGVYLEIPVTTTLLGILNGNAPVTLHIFAAAGV